MARDTPLAMIQRQMLPQTLHKNYLEFPNFPTGLDSIDTSPLFYQRRSAFLLDKNISHNRKYPTLEIGIINIFFLVY